MYDAVHLAKHTASAKFTESIDVALKMGLDARKADQVIRGAVALPHGTGKESKVAVFAKNPEIIEACKEAGAFLVGTTELLEQIKKGIIAFDRCLATPDTMGVVGQVGRILGPRGLMPNPKTKTIIADKDQLVSTIQEMRKGRVQFKLDKQGNLHFTIGNQTMEEEALIENLRTMMIAVGEIKPASYKGSNNKYIRKASVSSTMGPGIPIATDSVSPTHTRFMMHPSVYDSEYQQVALPTLETQPRKKGKKTLEISQ